MRGELPPDDLQNIWQSQRVEPIYMSIEEIRNKAAKFERRIRWRNLRETLVAVAMIPLFGLFLRWFPAPLERAGSCLIIVGLIYLIYRMNGFAAAAKVPAAGGFDACVAFHRRELERQRDLLRSIWLWYLGPLVPGILLFNLALIGQKIRHPADWWRVVPFVVIMAAWFWFVVRLNRRAADDLQNTIDALERAVEE